MSRDRRLLVNVWVLLALGGSGCATVGNTGNSVVPSRFKTETGPYTVFTNSPIAADDPAIGQLQALGRQVEATLGVRVDPKATPIEVYILDDRATFAHFLTFHHPEFPPRRAFFVAQGRSRVVYTYRQERLEEDLRHEATHALLNAAIGDVPLWLDEGLAEYFEGPEAGKGVNVEHIGKLPGDLASGWSPDLPRLEALKDVREMSPRDYREAWAWVHYLLDGTPSNKAALLAYLADLRSTAEPAPLSGRLSKDGGDAPKARLVAHIGQLREPPIAGTQTTQGRALRLQDEELPSRRRGFFGRVFGKIFGR